MHRLYAEINGRLCDVTNLPEAAAAPLLEAARRIHVAGIRVGDTVTHEPVLGRWTRGGREIAEAELPTGWDLQNGRRLQRPGGHENPHRPATKNKVEVRVPWRLASSADQISGSTARPTGRR